MFLRAAALKLEKVSKNCDSVSLTNDFPFKQNIAVNISHSHDWEAGTWENTLSYPD